MKTYLNKAAQSSKLLTTAYLFSALITTSVISSSVFAGNGSGYGGADFVTQSIPVEFENYPTINQVKDVEKQCVLEYHKKAFAQICQSINATVRLQEDEFYGLDTQENIITHGTSKVRCVSESNGFLYDMTLVTILSKKNFDIFINDSANFNQLRFKFSHLEIEKQNILTPAIEDIFKNKRNLSSRVKKVNIINETKNFAVKYYEKSKTTQELRDITIDNNRMAECMLTELQKIVPAPENQ